MDVDGFGFTTRDELDGFRIKTKRCRGASGIAVTHTLANGGRVRDHMRMRRVAGCMREVVEVVNLNL